MAIALDRPTLLTPGLKPVDPGFESWWVRPAGATVVRVRPGDRLTVRDPDGGQPAEVTVLDAEGTDDAAALGAHADAPASVLIAALDNGGAQGFLGELHRRGLAPHDARAIRLFATDSPPGAAESFTAARAATVVVGAPGGRVVEGGWPPSALVVEIHRAEPPTTAGEIELPAPLAEPRLDFRVDLASALSYEVREGEYIQIIDVRGRQCSDFLAFNAKKLQQGVERGLDAQVTRTLMGRAYPVVGLHSKY